MQERAAGRSNGRELLLFACRGAKKSGMLRKSVLYFVLVAIGLLLFLLLRLSEIQNTSWVDHYQEGWAVAPKERASRRKRFAVISMYSKNEYGARLKALTYRNKKEYCDKNGYDFIDALQNEDLLASVLYRNATNGGGIKRSTNSLKFEAIQFYLCKYDWILWSDADAIFLNHRRTLEEIVDEGFDVLVTASPADGTKWATILNTGHYFVKNSDWSKKFLTLASEMSVSDCRDHLNEVKTPNHSTILNGWLEICNRTDGTFWDTDQGVIQWILSFKDPSYRCHFKHYHFREFNSEFPWYGDGDLVLHFPGRPMQSREDLINLLHQYADFNGGIVNQSMAKRAKWRTRSWMADVSHIGGPYERDKYLPLYASLNRNCSYRDEGMERTDGHLILSTPKGVHGHKRKVIRSSLRSVGKQKAGG